MPFDSHHLPELPASAPRVLQCGDVEVRYPALTPADITAVCEAIVRNRNIHLSAMPVASIVEAIDAAAAKLAANITDTATLISAATGYSLPVVHETLAHMFADWRADSLNELLHAELPDARILDHPIPDPDVRNKQIAVFGYPLAFHVFSGNVPGVAVTSIVRSLLVKSATIGKLASGEPILPILFARALSDVAPEIASCLALSYWPGDEAALNAAALHAADVVVVYGGESAVESVRAQTDTGKRLVVHGPRLSFGIVGPQGASDDAAHAARAVSAYDQQGCVSPHVLYVHGTVEEARTFARGVAQQLESTARDLPRGRLSAEEAVAIRNARTAAEFGEGSELFGAETAGYSVIFEEDPAFRASCLNRLVYVKPLRQLQQLPGLLPRHDVLQSVALAGFPETQQAELIRMLGLCGVSRVTSFERLPWPPMHWHHDGSAPLRELMRWQDIEV